MKYKPLPFVTELRAIHDRSQKEAEDLRGAALVETMSTKGFQLVTGALREHERSVLNLLRSGGGPRPDHLMGQLHVINEIRRTLVAMLPPASRTQVDWYDEQEEAYVNVDGSQGGPDDA